MFDCWGIEFVGPFPPSFSCEYILVGVEYVSKWVHAMTCSKADGSTVIKFLKKNIFFHVLVLQECSSVTDDPTFATLN